MKDGTRVVHAGLPPVQEGQPFLPGPTPAAAYHLPGDDVTSRLGYGRYGNPSWTLFEDAVAELEGGTVLAFASGMAAVSAVLLATLRPGDVVVLQDDGYPGARWMAEGPLARSGVESRPVASTDEAVRAALPGSTLVWLESPTNPRLDLLDLPGLTEAAHREGALVAVDNTLPTPLGDKPLSYGADWSVVSATKHLSGHSDLLMGYAAVADDERAASLKAWRSQTGGIPGPFEAWLAHRSLATLEVRLQRQVASAAAVADLLRAREEVADVRYPGSGTLVSFTLGDADAARAFLAAAELVADATSFGGVHSSAERRARWGDAYDVPPGFIRFSAGIEDTADLVADVEQALDAAR